MANLYNLNDNEGEVIALIETSLDSNVVEKLWKEYYYSDQREGHIEEDSEIEHFVEIIKREDPEAEQRWIENIDLC